MKIDETLLEPESSKVELPRGLQTRVRKLCMQLNCAGEFRSKLQGTEKNAVRRQIIFIEAIAKSVYFTIESHTPLIKCKAQIKREEYSKYLTCKIRKFGTMLNFEI